MSPEQLEGHITEKSDIWSVGVILYMMLSNAHPAGRPPFIGDTIDSTADLIISEPVDCEDENLIHFSNKVKDLLEKLLHKDPDKRPSAEEALRDPWFDPLRDSKPEQSFCVNLLKHLIKFTVIANKSLPGIVKAVLRVICYHCKEVYNQTEIIELFKYIDRSNSGDISIDDLNSALNELELFEDAKGLMEKLCVERGHTLTYSDFVVATVNWKEELNPGLFLNLLDSTEKERISLLEMRKIFPNILDHELNSFFSKITNGDQGSVTVQKLYEEISALIAANSL